MVRAIGEMTLPEDAEIHCVWCGDEIEHEGLVHTTDNMASCWDCIDSKPWESEEETWDRPLDDTSTPILGDREAEDFLEEERDRKP